jgi:exopolysaccharide production protein ExoZ
MRLDRTAGRGSDETFESIQLLRGVAAILVTVFHAAAHAYGSENIFRVGNAGVDIFFVISGFVMWSATARRPPTPGAFLRHRVIRVVPLYYLFTFALLLAWLALPSAFPHMATPSARHVLLSLAFIPHIDPSGAAFPLLAQGWTLNFEMFFYLIFALGLTLPASRRFRPLAAMLLALPLLGLFIPDGLVRGAPLLGLLNPLLVEFLGGVLIARWASGDWRPGPRLCRAAVAFGAALLLFAPNPAADADWARLLLFGLPAFLIVGGAVGVELSSRSFRVGPAPLLLGASSYSLYLSHSFVISAVGKVLNGAPPWLGAAAATSASVLVAIAVFRLVEQPLLNGLRGRRRAPMPRVQAAPL